MCPRYPWHHAKPIKVDQVPLSIPMDTHVEFQKGCPLCEHTDPQLEREVYELVKILFESFLTKQGMPPMIFPSFEEFSAQDKKESFDASSSAPERR